ncbi:unnamed protein product [Gulo gulo]|uniref:Death domain-containing protein n=1 Tax=Gulo gulo TaxID=48420 RepID=A0A9X9LKE2_GULGU|nr:unnamed protein product [Gulo gulo]
MEWAGGRTGGPPQAFSDLPLAPLLLRDSSLCRRTSRVPSTWAAPRSALGIWGYSSPNVSPKPLVNHFLLPPDLRAAFDIVCDNVGKDWRRLARHLKVTDAKIDAIEEKYPRNLTEQVRESLRVWKSAEREDATVSHLVRALRACQLNLVADLVLEDQQARENEHETASSRGGDKSPAESLTSWDSNGPALGGPW